MAWAQNETSRDVSFTVIPNFDLNHWRFSSTREIKAMGASQIPAASSVKSSNNASGIVSNTSYCHSTFRRLFSESEFPALMRPIFQSGYDNARSDERNGSFSNRPNGLVW